MKVKTWTVDTYRRRTNHKWVAPDLLDRTCEFTLDEMHLYMDSVAECLERMDGFEDAWYHNYQIEYTAKDGSSVIIRPVPATYEED